ncbi:MAG: B12-binding domain-containing protein [Deltaproteobacteria bacterium]|nr:B12-binding domain-containing protein [Deltaproteobacteria bacterium]
MDISNLPEEHQNLLEALKKAIIEIDEQSAKQITAAIAEAKIDPNVAIKYAIAQGAAEIGEKFDNGTYFLPHLVMAGDLMDAIGRKLEKNLAKDRIQKKVVIIIGAVQGDMHSVGKNLVATMLRS